MSRTLVRVGALAAVLGVLSVMVFVVGVAMIAGLVGGQQSSQRDQAGICASPVVSGSHANPLVGRITSPYGARPNPFGAGVVPPQYPNEAVLLFHPGVDIAGVPEGTPFHSASDGVVTGTNVGGSFGGNRVIIDAGGGYEFIYGHAVDGSTVVKVGDQVKAGDHLAGTGTTGGSTGVHLHFEIRKDGRPIDPMQYMAQKGITLGQEGSVLQRASHRSPLPSPSAPGTSPPSAPLTVDAPSGSTITLTPAQQATAETIVSVGRQKGVSDRGIIIALMTALQESTLLNYANRAVPASLQHPHDKVGSDHDSVNAFQQRPAAGWGSVAELMNPTYAAAAFYGGPTGPNQGSPRGLLDIPGWEGMPLGQAAQRVQISAFPDAYDKWEPTAQQILARTEGSAPVQCTGASLTAQDGEQGSSAGSTQLPVPPTATREAILAQARKGVGGRYVWGGNSFGAWDCSGYVQWIHRQVGMNLPRVNQWTVGTRTEDPQPGDLVVQLWDERSQRWTHVGIYAGNGMMYSARNPSSGTTLHPVSWNGTSRYYNLLGD